MFKKHKKKAGSQSRGVSGSSIQFNSNTQLALIALGLLFSLILFARLLNFFSFFKKPFSTDLTVQRSYSWDGNSSINLLVATVSDQSSSPENKGEKTSQINLVNFQPKEQKITILNISKDIYLEVPKGYGKWSVGSIYALGQEEKPPQGAKILKLALGSLLGLPIDGILIYRSSDTNFEQTISSWRKNPISMLSFVRNVGTDLYPSELFKFLWLTSKVREDKMVSLDLARSDITESKLLPDSSRVLGANIVKLDTFIRDKMYEEGIVEENKSIAIFNATRHPGLAQEASRIITNMGGTVTMVANLDEVYTQSVLVNNKEESYEQNITLQRLAQEFAPNCLPKGCKSNNAKVIGSRADVTLVIGEDYYNYWNKR